MQRYVFLTSVTDSPETTLQNLHFPIVDVPDVVTLDISDPLRFAQLREIIIIKETSWGVLFVPRVSIGRELYEKIETTAHDEGISVSKLVERLIAQATEKKTMYCPRGAFKF